MCIRSLDDLIDEADRWEVAISLLSLYDAIEIINLPSMQPTQKFEWCWHHYNKYFSHISNIIIKVAKAEQIESELDYLIQKYRYEMEKRKRVINTGGTKQYSLTRRR
jgi:hypothetical protein